MYRCEEFEECYTQIKNLRQFDHRLDDEVMLKIAAAGILATSKYKVVPRELRRLAQRSTCHARGNRAGKNGNRLL
jgi:hypothetical protein